MVSQSQRVYVEESVRSSTASNATPQMETDGDEKMLRYEAGEYPKESMVGEKTMLKMPDLSNYQRDASQLNSIQGGGANRQPVINIMDNDVGEIMKVPQNPRWKEFAVEKPMKSQDYITYEVLGYDLKGNFQVRKRYSDFYMLRTVLRERWPGYYIPAIPPKKALGNMETDFIRNRLAHLDNFIKQLGQYSFLIESFEFSCFIRNSGTELEDQYKALLKETPQQIKEKYMQIIPIDAVAMPREQKMNCVIVLQKFQTFVSQAIRNLQGHKTEFLALEKKRLDVNKNYQSLFNKLVEYEHTGINFYTNNDNKKGVLSHPNHEYEQMIDGLTNKLGNPYTHIIAWIRREIYDLQGLQESIESVKAIEQVIAKEKKEISSLKEYVDDLNHKKTSFKTLWRSVTFRKQNVDECMQDIFAHESLVDGWEQVLEYVTYYIPMSIFPRFKSDRGNQYLQFMADYVEEHAEGADQNIEIWEKIAFFAQTDEENNNFMLTDRIREEIEEEEQDSYEEGKSEAYDIDNGDMDANDDALLNNPYLQDAMPTKDITSLSDRITMGQEVHQDVEESKQENEVDPEAGIKEKLRDAIHQRMDKHDETDLFERPPEMESNDSEGEDGETFDVPDKEE